MFRFVFVTALAIAVGCAWSIMTKEELSDLKSKLEEKGKTLIEEGTQKLGEGIEKMKEPDVKEATQEHEDKSDELRADAAKANEKPDVEGPKLYSTEKVLTAIADFESQLRGAKFDDAVAVLMELEPMKIPAAEQLRVKEKLALAENFTELLKLTDLGTTGEVPELKEITPTEGEAKGESFVAEIYREDRDNYFYRRPTGEKSRVEKWKVSVEPLAKTEAKVALKEVYEARKAEVEEDPTSVGWFELANFSFKNGLNEEGVGALTEAMRVSSSVVADVLDHKAYRLYLTFWYFYTNGNQQDATRTRQVLQTGYPDSPYVARIQQEMKELEAELIAAAAPIRAQRDRDPDEVKDPVGAEPIVGQPVQEEREDGDVPDDIAAAAEEGKQVIVQGERQGGWDVERVEEKWEGDRVDGTTGGANDVEEAEAMKTSLAMIKQGNEHYETALEHLRLSDPVANPKEADWENLEALEWFKKAFHTYLEAQEIVESMPSHPKRQWLRDRVRDTNFKRAGCMKRAVYTKRR